jgi:hypothetical protein
MQQQIVDEQRRFNVLCMGRRFGKTTLGIDQIIKPVLAGGKAGWFAPEDRFYEEVWRDLLYFLEPVITYKNAGSHRLDIIGGGTIELWNMARPENVARSRKYDIVCVDEVAIISGMQNAWNNSIQATLIDFEGKAWFFSTPKGFNFFHNLYQRGVDADKKVAAALAAGEPAPDVQWKSWQFPSMANPHLKPAELQRMKDENTPKDYSQEILAQFLGEGTAVFPNVQELATEPLRARNPAHKYAIGVDWGRENDATVFTVIDLTTKCIVWIQTTEKIEFHHQRALLQGLCDDYSPSMVLVEMNSIGTPNFEELARSGLPVVSFWTTNASKLEIVDALVLCMARRFIHLLSNDQHVGGVAVGQIALNELHSYAAKKLPSGLVHYGAPEGIHDDYVMSIMLAWMCALSPDKRAFKEADVLRVIDPNNDGLWAL